MSNEELVTIIQNGDNSKLPELWESVSRFVAKIAHSYMVFYDGRYGVELEDLIQAGFLAMVEASKNYEPGEAKFTTYLAYHLKTAFAEAANRRTKSQKENPLHNAKSIYEPVPGAEDEETLLLDIIPGPDAFEDVEAKIYRQQLRADLEAVLSTIPARNADVLRLHFFEDKELTEIAASRGVSTEAVSACKRDGLQAMRRKTNTKQGAKLKEYIESHTNYYIGMGYGHFINTQTSPIENAVLRREQLEKQFAYDPIPAEWRKPTSSILTMC